MSISQLLLFVAQLLNVLLVLVFIRILFQWIMPPHKWGDQPLKILFDVTEPMLAPFRNLIPPIGGTIDISPMILFIVMQLLIGLLHQLAYRSAGL